MFYGLPLYGTEKLENGFGAYLIIICEIEKDGIITASLKWQSRIVFDAIQDGRFIPRPSVEDLPLKGEFAVVWDGPLDISSLMSDTTAQEWQLQEDIQNMMQLSQFISEGHIVLH